MQASVFLIAILGCSEGDAPCQEVRIADARYESRAQCVAMTEVEVARHTDLPYPVIVAECRDQTEAPRALRPGDVRLPEPPSRRSRHS
jgi:hypothetical protein